MMRARFISPANDDVSEAAEHYLNTDPDAGRRFFEELDRATNLIETNPRIGRPAEHDTYRLTLQRFPYDVVYEIHPHEIVVIAVAHHRRERSYWISRLS
ncbi:MAG TPA: type II toxin-antitoxin system RelE/ParE family toxin [Longimicrobium sp.]|jgi:plasmid stabilization system protein ParE